MESNLFAKAISDLIQILDFEEGHGAPSLDPLLVECVIVQWEDGLDILPFTFLRYDTCSSLLLRACNKMVYDAEFLSLRQGLTFQGFLGLSGWFSGSNAVKPIFDPKANVNGRTCGSREGDLP